ncbi:hypothetical protein V1512DRAFT_260146 [Lipomyces arxii]|uniref:uncharacterized protein n=1 Tax=Lipomyces arxii TaxID=56418 RepID=UPI0034CF5EB0
MVSSFTSSQYRKIIWYSLDNGLDQSATFAAERLVAQDPTDLSNVHLLARCHLAARRFKVAMHLTEDRKHIGCVYIYAKCCLELGRFRLGCRALERCRSIWPKTCHIYNHSDSDRQHLPDLPAVQCLLGHLYRAFGDATEAVEAYTASLSANPFIWEAFEGLCALGVTIKVPEIYKLTPAVLAARSSLLDNADLGIENAMSYDPFVADQTDNTHPSIFATRLNTHSNSADEDDVVMTSDSRMQRQDSVSRRTPSNTKDMPTRRSSRLTGGPSQSSQPQSSHSPSQAQLRAGLARATLTASTGTPTAAGVSTTGVRGRLRALKRLTTDPVKVVPDDAERIEAEGCMLSLYETLATGTYALARYECKAALAAFQSLPADHQDSPFVLSKVGIAYFETVRYRESEDKFKRLRVVDPMRVDDMEIYSTLLWHLRKDVELSFLAHELADIDRMAPATWIAIGNSFSLQKEHDQALKCFRRASRLDPTFAYCYTLQGHEHLANEDFESAQNAFRLAMRAEWRHYNAWYGLGMVFLKTGKFELAEQHFRQAAMINPGNSVLVCCIGMVLEKLRRFDEALQQYDIASSLQPSSALPRFKKARLLMGMRRYQACMDELRIVRNLAPDESSVHYLLGRLYKAQGDKQNAIKYFTAALNLDPKASHVIKEAIEGLDSDGE